MNAACLVENIIFSFLYSNGQYIILTEAQNYGFIRCHLTF